MFTCHFGLYQKFVIYLLWMYILQNFWTNEVQVRKTETNV